MLEWFLLSYVSVWIFREASFEAVELIEGILTWVESKDWGSESLYLSPFSVILEDLLKLFSCFFSFSIFRFFLASFQEVIIPKQTKILPTILTNAISPMKKISITIL